VNNRQKTISSDEKLNVLSQPEKGERIIDICHEVRLAHSSIRTIPVNADRITGNAKSGTEVFVYQDYHSPIVMNYTKNYGCESHTFYCIRNK
jgi:hypothetical protein